MKILSYLILAILGLARFSAMAQNAAPANPPMPGAPAPAVPPKPVNFSDYVVFQKEQAEYEATNGEAEAHVKFVLTNISSEVVTVQSVRTSCHCTTAHLPAIPFALAPGTNMDLNVTVDLAGKSGIIFKNVTFNTDKGSKTLLVKVTILAPGAMGAREMNQKIATGDHQAVFKGDCATCHVAKGQGKTGKELFMADCAICHEAEHRASAVPDLHHLTHQNSRELWEIWITYGKAGSMMPGFGKTEGGPLSDEQIRSLASYLSDTIPASTASLSQKPGSK